MDLIKVQRPMPIQTNHVTPSASSLASLSRGSPLLPPREEARGKLELLKSGDWLGIPHSWYAVKNPERIIALFADPRDAEAFIRARLT